MSENDVDVTLAMAYYEHVADVVSGKIPLRGVRLRWLELPVEEIFHRFIEFREWHSAVYVRTGDVTEPGQLRTVPRIGRLGLPDLTHGY